MIRRIGFACKYMHHDQTLKKKQLETIQRPHNSKSTTVAWLDRQTCDDAEQRLWEIIEHNVTSFCNLINYVGGLPANRRMVRLGSDCLPLYSHPKWNSFYKHTTVQSYCEKEFAKIGELARKLDVRLSFHPGQFTVLASDSPDVVNRSIDEFEYHVDMIRWMGYGKQFQDFKCNVHISGRQGPQGIINVLPRLSPEARNTITIENDEMSWGLDASLELAKHCALVLDIHHHFVREGEYISHKDARFKTICDSWRGVRPVIHYSYSRNEHLPEDFEHDDFPNMKLLLEAGHKKQKLRAHSDFYPNKVVNDWALQYLEHADIMAESKAKNLASEQLYKQALESGYL